MRTSDGTGRRGEPRTFRNVYEDDRRAGAYADLEFPGTYYLAFRDLPDIFERHVRGSVALDFGCGAGRSSRFLRDFGFTVLGVDISEPMLKGARARDANGEYVLIPDGDLSDLRDRRFDLVLCAFTFDNIPTRAKRLGLFQGLGSLLASRGRIVNLVSAPEIYVNEWASFSTKDCSGPAPGRGRVLDGFSLPGTVRARWPRAARNAPSTRDGVRPLFLGLGGASVALGDLRAEKNP
jgi:SAM-dependent methyltransferase